jgi:hypothetical protein
MMRKLIILLSLTWASVLTAQEESISSLETGSMAPDQAEHFDIMQLPRGASVVLPHPASTLVPLNLNVQVSSTDRKQILKIGAVSRGASRKAVSLAIYDSHQTRVKYLKIKPGSFVIYPFRKLNSLRIVPQNHKDPALQGMRLLLESNRPMGVRY